jgi:hypothetical protein
VAAWLTLQLFVLLYFLWLERVEGRDHNRGMFFGTIMAVLLFPGGEIVMYLLGIPFWAAEALGHPILVQNEMLASVLTLLLWGSSAFIRFASGRGCGCGSAAESRARQGRLAAMTQRSDCR